MNGRLTCEAVARAEMGEPLKIERDELLYRCVHSERHNNGDAHPSLKVDRRKDLWLCANRWSPSIRFRRRQSGWVEPRRGASAPGFATAEKSTH
jgi:hypothetical protein